MRILYVSQYYPPEVNAPAQRVADFANAWKAAGHDVVVLTGFPNHPTGQVYGGYRLRPLQRETIDGVQVLRTYLYPTPNKGTFRRCLNYASFMSSAATIGCLAAGKVDIVVASCPQLLVGVAGWTISKFRRVPFVLGVRDVWPEALAAVGVQLNRHVYMLLERTARFLYKRADRIVTVTRGAQEVIKKYGVPDEKLELIPTGISSGAIKPTQPPADLRSTLGAKDGIVVSYIGTHGMAQQLSTVLEAAKTLSDEPKIHFVLLGDGADKDNLVRMKQDLALSNVHFLDQAPQAEALRYISASDICLVPLRKAELFRETIPSKMYEIMACARPMILGVDGEARELLESASAGVFVEPEDPAALAAAVLNLARDPESRSRYGENGRRFVVAHYDKRVLAQKYLTLLSSLVSSPTSQTRSI